MNSYASRTADRAASFDCGARTSKYMDSTAASDPAAYILLDI